MRELTTDTDDASMVRAVISMGENLQMLVVAECMETRDQLDFLREHACPEGQALYFGHPVIAGEFTQLMGYSAVERRALQVY